jgi:hypothetical protein
MTPRSPGGRGRYGAFFTAELLFVTDGPKIVESFDEVRQDAFAEAGDELVVAC